MTTRELAIGAVIGGRLHARADVLAWEDKRIDAAATKLGVARPPAAPIPARRENWLETKRAIGDEEMLRRLARDTRLAGLVSAAQARVTSRRRACVTELFVQGASSGRFTEWFNHITFESDRDAMELACPDHFVLRMHDGAQQVVETNGGSPFTAAFDIDYDDVSSLSTPVDPLFGHRLDGVARGGNGRPIGGVRHQFRNIPGGVHARLVVEFPLLIPETVVRGHRWHLACEFSNWFEAAVAAEGA
ncbi:hypothetical protein [Gordonia sp. VNK21]|uniref:hypothetical protein n=1 Tax=Gordonia sp. VNK21 TaxID=3382483 RepID=UPI0038D518EC